MCCEHQVEVSGCCECSLVSADRARCVQIDLVSSETALALLAVDHRVGEVADMAAGLPDSGVHENRCIQSDDVVVQLGHLLPPQVTDVVLELDSEWTVIIGSVESSVYLTALENESTSSAE